MLDLEAFTYLTRALESTISPIVILASNRGLTPIRGADPSLPPAAHGIPPDLLARLLIIPTFPYQPDEIRAIVRSRARVEGINLSDEGLTRLTEFGSRVSLRYAIQLLAPASVLAQVGGKLNKEVGVAEVDESESLFLDAGRSAKLMGDEASGFVM